MSVNREIIEQPKVTAGVMCFNEEKNLRSFQINTKSIL